MKFYATRPSRARLADDVLAFVSLLKFQRDEQAEKLVLSSAGGPAAAALHAALAKAGMTSGLEDPGLEGGWREKIEDPLDPYGPEAAKQVDFAPGKTKDTFGDALYRIHWDRNPTAVIGRFRVEPKGAGFTLGFAGFEAAPVPRPAPKQPAGGGLFGDGPKQGADASGAKPAAAKKPRAPRKKE